LEESSKTGDLPDAATQVAGIETEYGRVPEELSAVWRVSY
jgi:hypothetical protein